ncbi:MAG: hypothetical protein CVU58_08440, partial [Deltaproteobacteria bacterium HGW-Deltaproteobacteria-16]
MIPTVPPYLPWLKIVVNRYTLFLLFFLGCTEILQQTGGLPALLPAWRLEIPLLLYLYFLFNQLLRRSRLQPLVAAAPLVLLYGVFDVYYRMFGRMLRITEITELPEMLQILPPLGLVLIVVLIGLPLLAFLAFLEVPPRRLAPVVASLPLMALLLMVEMTPDFFMT